MRKELEIMLDNKKNLEDFFYPDRDPKERYNHIERILGLEDFEEEDWTFRKADTKEFTHVIFSEYPARMIPQIARKLIKKYYPKHSDETKKKPILDPFAGSGTTGAEAILRNIDAITFDLNPLAHLIQKVKTSIMNPKQIKTKYKEIKSIIEENKDTSFDEYIPKNINVEFWYKKIVTSELSVIRFAIESTFELKKLSKINQDLKDFFLVCFGKTARSCSYQRLGEHKTYRIPREKIDKFDKEVDTLKTFILIYEEYLKGKILLYNYYRNQEFKAKCDQILGDSMILRGIENNSIDLVVTSPPYGDSHTTVAYGQFSRFPLEWIFIDKNDLQRIDNNLLGGKKQDKALEKSRILLKTCKRILMNEIIQQKKAIEDHLELYDIKLKEHSKQNNRISALFSDVQKEIISLKDMGDSASKKNNLEELLDLKNNYFSKAKEIRNICKQMNRELATEDRKENFGKIRIYDDRIGYVLSFFTDFFIVFKRLYDVLDTDCKCCFVIGNRTVKSVLIPNDEIIIELGKSIGFEYITTFYRDIPSKRIPKRTAPSNIEGETESTIEKESIIILNKRKRK